MSDSEWEGGTIIRSGPKYGFSTSSTSPEHTCHDELVDVYRKWEQTHNRENYGRYDAFKAGYEAAGRKAEMPPFKQFQIGAALNGIAMTKAKMLYDYLATQIEGDK